MAQQLALIVLVDIANALDSSSLDGNVYLFDNMKFQGSEGNGTGNLVTAVRGTYWRDGSQGTEQVLNWLPASLGSIPPSVPRNYHHHRAAATDRQALADLEQLTRGPAATAAETNAGLGRIQRSVGRRPRTRHPHSHLATHKVLDVTGHVVTGDVSQAHSYPMPVITDVSGQAVEEKIIYPAEYGSPDMVSDGWYWSATVDTSRPGTYTYTMGIQLHDLKRRNGEYAWEPVNLTFEAGLKVTAEPMRNAFTKGGMGMLPIPSAPPAPAAPTATS